MKLLVTIFSISWFIPMAGVVWCDDPVHVSGNPETVTGFEIRGKGTNTFPTKLLPFKNLQSLTLQDEPLVRLPSKIGTLTNLRSLTIRGTKLRQLPPEIGQLKNLRELFIFRSDLGLKSNGSTSA